MHHVAEDVGVRKLAPVRLVCSMSMLVVQNLEI
jgi:hypothetical protein